MADNKKDPRRDPRRKALGKMMKPSASAGDYVELSDGRRVDRRMDAPDEWELLKSIASEDPMGGTVVESKPMDRELVIGEPQILSRVAPGELEVGEPVEMSRTPADDYDAPIYAKGNVMDQGRYQDWGDARAAGGGVANDGYDDPIYAKGNVMVDGRYQDYRDAAPGAEDEELERFLARLNLSDLSR